LASNLETRIFRLEQLIQAMQQQIASLQASVAQLQQQQWAAGLQYPQGGGSNAVYWLVPTSTIAAGTYPAAGPAGGPLTGQTVYALGASGYTALSGTYSVYNPRGAIVTASKLTAVTIDSASNAYVIDWDC
jgi:hypothetical protein